MYYIVEHPTRGVLMEWDWDDKWKFKFSPTKSRSEAHRFFSLAHTEEIMNRMEDKLKHSCYVLTSKGWTTVA